MDRGVVPPCLELGDEPEHRLLAWAGRKTGRQGLVLLSENKLVYRIEREVPGAGIETLQHLEDAGYVEKVSVGESYRYRVLAFCACSGGNPPSGYPAPAREPILGAKRRMGEVLLSVVGSTSLSVGGSGVKSESVQKSATTGYLAKVVFPRVVRDAGIELMPQCNYAALIHHLNRWKLQGTSVETMELMIEEFGRHPEWCQRSRKPPWQIFVARVEELGSLIAFQKQKDPANRRWSGGGRDYWFGPTPRVYSPA